MRNLQHWLRIVESDLHEDQPRRNHDEQVAVWFDTLRKRPDRDSLYIHGSNHVFDAFKQPNVDYGQLIFSSKLMDDRNKVLQAEYYGQHLYAITFDGVKKFDPLNDPTAKKILETSLDGEFRSRWSEDGETKIHSGVWDYQNKIQSGRIDYQDCHLVIPPAVAAGYNMFRIYEISMRDYSHGFADANMVTIIDRI